MKLGPSWWACTGRPTAMALGFTAAMLVGAGIVLSEDERDVLCKPGAGRPPRGEWEHLRWTVFTRGGVPWADHLKYEVTYIIPPCLGGPNTLDNLQLLRCDEQDGPRCVAGEAYWNDRKGATICREYCNGNLTLEQARDQQERDQLR